jgi:RimJ/RimL family protein N-acetyltransferase
VTAGPAAGLRRFETPYAALRANDPALGEIGVLPWDGEIFGFAVADYRLRSVDGLERGAAEFVDALEGWALRNAVELVACRAPADSTRASTLLEAAGFRFIELQMQATLARLDPERLSPCHLTVRAAERADHEAITTLAGSAFAHGRYHSDSLFPRSLADRRFRAWMQRAISEATPATWIGVVGPAGQPAAFLHAETESGVADIRLTAADPEKASLAGPELVLGTLHALASRGARRVTARLSAANSAAINVYASLGFRFHEPAVVLHWIRPGAPHLGAPTPA